MKNPVRFFRDMAARRAQSRVPPSGIAIHPQHGAMLTIIAQRIGAHPSQVLAQTLQASFEIGKALSILSLNASVIAQAEQEAREAAQKQVVAEAQPKNGDGEAVPVPAAEEQVTESSEERLEKLRRVAAGVEEPS